MTKNYLNIEHNQSAGNAMIYVLIALALFGFLTVTLSNQNNQADGQDMDDEQAALYANELISYVASAQQVVDMMISTGTEVDDLDFVIPSDTAFDTPPHHNKVFHPAGGGLNYTLPSKPPFYEVDDTASPPGEGWFFTKRTHVEWTPTAAKEIIFTALYIQKEVCEEINKIITGSRDIPQITTTSSRILFANHGGASDFLISYCPECQGHHLLCTKGGATTDYAFYNIIVAQ